MNLKNKALGKNQQLQTTNHKPPTINQQPPTINQQNPSNKHIVYV